MGAGFGLCPNPETQGVAKPGAKLLFCNAGTLPLEKVQKSLLPFRERGSSLSSVRFVFFFLNKSLVEEDRQKVLSLSITDVLRLGHTQQLKSRGLEQGLGAGPVASSRIVLIREGFRAAWTQVTQFRTAFYILACFPTERIKTTSTYLLVPW